MKMTYEQKHDFTSDVMPSTFWSINCLLSRLLCELSMKNMTTSMMSTLLAFVLIFLAISTQARTLSGNLYACMDHEQTCVIS